MWRNEAASSALKVSIYPSIVLHSFLLSTQSDLLSRFGSRHATPGAVAAGAPSLLDAVGPDAGADHLSAALLWVGRVTVRPIAFVTLGANFASYGSDSTRYGVDAAVEYMGAAIEGEYIGQRRD